MVLREQIAKYKEVFIKTTEQVNNYFTSMKILNYYTNVNQLMLIILKLLGRKIRSVFEQVFKCTACCFAK